jgi:hypothetical protein
VEASSVHDFGGGFTDVIAIVLHSLDELIYTDMSQKPNFFVIGHAFIDHLKDTPESSLSELLTMQAFVEQGKHRLRQHTGRINPPNVALKSFEG